MSRVTPEGAAERAGLQLGDKLLSVSTRHYVYLVWCCVDIQNFGLNRIIVNYYSVCSEISQAIRKF